MLRVLAIILLTVASASAATIAEKTAGLEKRDGLFPLYWDVKTGNLFLEIPKTGDEFLFYTSLPAGLGSNDIGLDRGQVGRSRLLRFERIGPKILLTEANQRFRSSSPDPLEQKAVADSFASTVHWGFAITAEEGTRVLIDLTPFVLRDGHDASAALRRSRSGTYKIDPTRSVVYLDRTRSFPANTEIEVLLTFTGEPQGGLVASVSPSAEAFTVREHYSFVALPAPGVTPQRQRATLDLLQKMNDLDTQPEDSEMAARIASYELAFKMQAAAPDAVDITKESEETRKLYGIDKPQTRDFGTRLLLARRMVERGVRFVQVYSGGGPVSIQWDAHSNLVNNHEKMAGLTDQPIAALLNDLKARGLLDSTLVIWGSEFGRLPMSESGNGRDHNPHGYTMWFAGGGAKGGTSVGETDELGLRGIGERYHMRDFHATMLHMLGLDQHKLFYLHNGRNEKLTDFGGNLITKLYS